MDFYGAIGTVSPCEMELVPEGQRLVRKTYLKDEAREKAIESVYSETGSQVPDEAPIWNQYSTQVYSPATFRSRGPMTLVCSFGNVEAAVRTCFEDVKTHLKSMRRAKRSVI